MDAARVAEEHNRAARLDAKRDGTRAARAAAAAAAKRKSADVLEQRRVLNLVAHARALSATSAPAWAELEPLLRERVRGLHVVAARNAAERLRELAPLHGPVAPPLMPPLAHLPVAPPVAPLGTLPPVDPSRPLRVASLFDGYGGALIALLAALVGSSVLVEVVHAADRERGKVALAAAVAAASGVPHAPPQRADIADETLYTAAFCASWGVLDLLVAGFPCIYHSPEGRKEGVARNLRLPECKALADAFFRVLSLTTARVVVVECSAFLAADPFFQSDFLDRLEETFWVAHVVLDASRWLPMNRERIYLLCFREHAAYEAFSGVAEPPQREVRLDAVIFAADDARLPRSVYDASRSARSGKVSVAARSVAKQPLLKGKARSAIGVFKRDAFRALATAKRVSAGKRAPKTKHALKATWRAVRRGVKRAVAPTLIHSSSGVLRLRDGVGTRSLCARECGALLGVPLVYIEAMLRVASDAAVVSALGDGFAVPVVRDVLKAVLRVCGYGV